MKKILFYTLMLCAGMTGLTSCNDDEDQLTDSRLTYYPVLELNGDEVVTVPVGTAYNEQSCTATMQGEDCSSKVVISGAVDTNTIGLYTVYYSLTNSDGFSSSTSRTVIVYDPTITTDISGTYTVQEGTYRNYNGKLTAFAGYTVDIEKVAPGIFYVSDFLAGYYDQRAGYGENYACTGYMNLNSDNTLKLLSSSVAGWGDSLEKLDNGTYDPATGEVNFTATYVSMDFVVKLKK